MCLEELQCSNRRPTLQVALNQALNLLGCAGGPQRCGFVLFRVNDMNLHAHQGRAWATVFGWPWNQQGSCEYFLRCTRSHTWHQSCGEARAVPAHPQIQTGPCPSRRFWRPRRRTGGRSCEKCSCQGRPRRMTGTACRRVTLRSSLMTTHLHFVHHGNATSRAIKS
jgi:hypothetical protein